MESQIISQKHSWTREDDIIATQCYKQRLSISEASQQLPHIKIKSIQMKYANCKYLEYGPGRGALAHCSQKHRSIWNELLNQNI
jgi:hypothetical protein